MFTNFVPERKRPMHFWECWCLRCDCKEWRRQHGPELGQLQVMPYSAKGSQQDITMNEACLNLSLLPYLGPASYVIHNAIHRLLVLFCLRWSFSSWVHVPWAGHTFCVKSQLPLHKDSAQKFQTAVWHLSSQDWPDLKVALPKSPIFRLVQGREVIRAKEHNRTYVPPKAFSGRTPGISPDPHPWNESRLLKLEHRCLLFLTFQPWV